MSGRTGLSGLEVAVIEAVADLGGVPDAGYRRLDRVVARVEQQDGYGGRYTSLVATDLAAAWRLHLPLLEGNGNWGGRGDDPPAEPRYREVRMSTAGALALATERGETGPIPLGLIEGSLYRDGPVPPFEPRALVHALVHGTGYAGPPALPSGGHVEGDVAGLLAGRRARLELVCTVVEEQPRPGAWAQESALVVIEAPFTTNMDQLALHLSGRLSHGLKDIEGTELPGMPRMRAHAPVAHVRDESSARVGIRIVCRLQPGATTEDGLRWMQTVWPFRILVDCRLPAPMRRRLLDWDRGDGSGLRALADLLAC